MERVDSTQHLERDESSFTGGLEEDEMAPNVQDEVVDSNMSFLVFSTSREITACHSHECKTVCVCNINYDLVHMFSGSILTVLCEGSL